MYHLGTVSIHVLNSATHGDIPEIPVTREAKTVGSKIQSQQGQPSKTVSIVYQIGKRGGGGFMGQVRTPHKHKDLSSDPGHLCTSLGTVDGHL